MHDWIVENVRRAQEIRFNTKSFEKKIHRRIKKPKELITVQNTTQSQPNNSIQHPTQNPSTTLATIEIHIEVGIYF